MASKSAEMKKMQVVRQRRPGGLIAERDVRGALSSALQKEYPDKKAARGVPLSDPYVDEILFRATGGQVICDSGGDKYRHDFSIAPDGSVTLKGEGEEVVQKTEYVPVDEEEEDKAEEPDEDDDAKSTDY